MVGHNRGFLLLGLSLVLFGAPVRAHSSEESPKMSEIILRKMWTRASQSKPYNDACQNTYYFLTYRSWLEKEQTTLADARETLESLSEKGTSLSKDQKNKLVQKIAVAQAEIERLVERLNHQEKLIEKTTYQTLMALHVEHFALNALKDQLEIGMLEGEKHLEAIQGTLSERVKRWFVRSLDEASKSESEGIDISNKRKRESYIRDTEEKIREQKKDLAEIEKKTEEIEKKQAEFYRMIRSLDRSLSYVRETRFSSEVKKSIRNVKQGLEIASITWPDPVLPPPEVCSSPFDDGKTHIVSEEDCPYCKVRWKGQKDVQVSSVLRDFTEVKAKLRELAQINQKRLQQEKEIKALQNETERLKEGIRKLNYPGEKHKESSSRELSQDLRAEKNAKLLVFPTKKEQQLGETSLVPGRSSEGQKSSPKLELRKMSLQNHALISVEDFREKFLGELKELSRVETVVQGLFNSGGIDEGLDEAPQITHRMAGLAKKTTQDSSKIKVLLQKLPQSAGASWGGTALQKGFFDALQSVNHYRNLLAQLSSSLAQESTGNKDQKSYESRFRALEEGAENIRKSVLRVKSVMNQDEVISQ